MNNLFDKLKNMGYTLPDLPASGGNYLASRRAGEILYLAGVISTNAEGVIKGRLGNNLTLEQGYNAARACALTQLASIQATLGNLECVDQILTLNGYVCCAPEFIDCPKVINGASDLLIAVFGERGWHTRTAIGVMSLPQGAAVEIQMTIQVMRS